MCVCMCETEGVCVCVCEREGEGVCVCVSGGGEVLHVRTLSVLSDGGREGVKKCYYREQCHH